MLSAPPEVTVKVTASADTMANLPVGIFSYDIQQKVGDVVTTILRGTFTLAGSAIS